MRRNLANYLSANPQTGLIDITFPAKSLLSIQKGSVIIPTNDYTNTNTARRCTAKLQNSRDVVSNVNTDFLRTQVRCERRWSTSPLLLYIKSLGISTSSHYTASSLPPFYLPSTHLSARSAPALHSSVMNGHSLAKKTLRNWQLSAPGTCQGRLANSNQAFPIARMTTTINSQPTMVVQTSRL